jgi:hypothetical protein
VYWYISFGISIGIGILGGVGDILPITQDCDYTRIGRSFEYTDKESKGVHPFYRLTDCHQAYQIVSSWHEYEDTSLHDIPVRTPQASSRGGNQYFGRTDINISCEG